MGPFLLLLAGMSGTALAQSTPAVLPPCSAAELEAKSQAPSQEPGSANLLPPHPVVPPPATCSPAAVLDNLQPTAQPSSAGSPPAQAAPAPSARQQQRNEQAAPTPLVLPLEPDLDLLPQVSPDQQRGVEIKGLLRWRLPEQP